VLALDLHSQDAFNPLKPTGESWVRAEVDDGLKDGMFLADRELDGRTVAESDR
jgi:hypothetical protein